MLHDWSSPTPTLSPNKSAPQRALPTAWGRYAAADDNVHLPAEDASHRLAFTEGYAPYSQCPGGALGCKGAGGLLNGVARTV